MIQTIRRQTKRMGWNAMSSLAILPGSRLFFRRYQCTGRDKGARRLMEPKLIIRPNGRAPIRVMKNSCRVFKNPLFRADKTVWKVVEVKNSNMVSSSQGVCNGRVSR